MDMNQHGNSVQVPVDSAVSRLMIIHNIQATHLICAFHDLALGSSVEPSTVASVSFYDY